MASYEDIIQAFRQGEVNEGGNCASIALIKAAIDTFGLNKVFEYQQAGGQHKVKFRDEVEINFTDQELAITTERADFHLRKGDDAAQTQLYNEIYNYANVCFCAMVKNVMRIGECGSGVGDFEDAIVALNDGADSDDIHVLLGIQNVRGPKRWMPTANQKGFVVWKPAHCVFASNGFFDHYGEVRTLGLKFPQRMQLIS